MPSIKLSVINSNATTYPCDILVLKYAQENYGLDYQITNELSIYGIPTDKLQPAPNKHYRVNSNNVISAKEILFIGTPTLDHFRYEQIRKFTKQALYILRESTCKKICFTLHGVGYGLDIKEAFESEISGIIDAITSNQYPNSLEEIVIIERDKYITQDLLSSLQDLVPSGYLTNNLPNYLDTIPPQNIERYRAAGYSSESKPHIFVAMPFKDDMDDVYHYGIQNAVRNSGFLCERADLSSFTGDIMTWVRDRIKSSSFVVADLTDANPNVYLEVGYAWGANIPTILLARSQNDLKFDVQQQRCIVYSKIKDLEERLTQELTSLKNNT